MADNEIKSSTDLDTELSSNDGDSKSLEEQEREKKENLAMVDGMLESQLSGVSVHNIAVEWKDCDEKRVRIAFWDDRALLLAEPSVRLVSDNLSGSAKCDTLESLALILSKVAPPEDQEYYSNGGWVHGDSCPATIVACEANLNYSHVTTGRGMEFLEGELGRCTLLAPVPPRLSLAKRI